MRTHSRILLAVVLLGTIVAWARCSFNPRAADTDFNGPFAGCFEGAVTEPVGAGTVVVVLEEPVVGDQFALSGCLRAIIGEKTPFLSLAGSVQDERELAVFGGVEAGKAGFRTVEITRRPAGFGDATEIDVAIEGGDPFAVAIALTRCATPPATCAGLAAAIAPAPQPALVLP
jgi:hypothetical protein